MKTLSDYEKPSKASSRRVPSCLDSDIVVHSGGFQQALSLATLALSAVTCSASCLRSWVTRNEKCQEVKETMGICVLLHKQSRKTTAQALLVIVTPPAAPVKQCHKIPNTKSVLKMNACHVTLEGGWLQNKNVTKEQKPVL